MAVTSPRAGINRIRFEDPKVTRFGFLTVEDEAVTRMEVRPGTGTYLQTEGTRLFGSLTSAFRGIRETNPILAGDEEN